MSGDTTPPPPKSGEAPPEHTAPVVPPPEASKKEPTGGDKPAVDDDKPARGDSTPNDEKEAAGGEEGRAQRTAEAEREPDIAPGSLSMRKEARRYGYAITTDAAAVGDNAEAKVEAHFHMGPRELKSRTSRRRSIQFLIDTYASAGVDDRLATLLDDHSVVCLTGGRGTGRFTTACVTAGKRHGADNVHEIHLPPGTPPRNLQYESDLPVRGQGHVLRLRQADPAELIRVLDGIFRDRDATLILIRDAEAGDGEPHAAEVYHKRVPPELIFERHLRHLLTGRCTEDCTPCDAGCISRYIKECLADVNLGRALATSYRPREIVAIATALAGKVPRGSAIRDMLTDSQPVRRERAATILLPGKGAPIVGDNRRHQYERAFRIAYAVFDRKPLEFVFESAGLLLDQIDEDSGRPVLGRLPFDRTVEDLLGDPLGQDWSEGHRQQDDLAPGASRTAWLRDPEMLKAMLDVTWHHLDNTRPSLLSWLDRLARHDKESVRRSVATVAGMLAHYDFDTVHERLIDGWSRAPRFHLRQCAAWAAVFASLDGQVTDRVRDKVREWVWKGGALQRDTAARAYASGLPNVYPEWTLLDLEQVAVDPFQRPRGVVAEAINQVYQRETAGRVIPVIAGWAQSRNRLLWTHAARSLLVLAPRIGTHPNGEGPDLLIRVSTGEADVDGLSALWTVALLDPTNAHKSWPLLGFWLRQADSHHLTPAAAELLRSLHRRPAVRRRLDFYLRNPRSTWFKMGVPAWISYAMRDV